MSHTSKLKFEDQIHKVFAVPPNDLGNRRLTMLYKRLTGPLKQMTFFYIIPLALILSIVLYILLDHLFIELANILQYGF